MRIKKAIVSDAKNIAQLASLMWTEHKIEDLTEEFSQMINKNDTVIFLGYKNEILIGFAQCQLRRDYVEGTKTSPVGYLEGIFIKEQYRKNGYAKLLLKECEHWAKMQGCSEFASDCELNNNTSLAFHLKVGFVEANKIICFTKCL